MCRHLILTVYPNNVKNVTISNEMVTIYKQKTAQLNVLFITTLQNIATGRQRTQPLNIKRMNSKDIK